MKNNINKFVFEVFDCYFSCYYGSFNTYKEAFDFVCSFYKENHLVLIIRKVRVCCSYDFNTLCKFLDLTEEIFKNEKM